MTRTEVDLHAYVRQLEEHLRLAVFGGDTTDPESAVLLVRGALAADDRARAAELAEAAEKLVADSPGAADMAAAGAHVRGLVEEDPAALDWAATTYSSLLGRAWATEDAGMACAHQGNRAAAVDRLQEAYALYQKLEVTDCMDRVRARLRATGVRRRHWSYSDRPAFGWASLTAPSGASCTRRPRGQQSPDSEPHVPQRAHDRVSHAPGVLQARRLLPGAAGQPGRGAGWLAAVTGQAAGSQLRPRRAGLWAAAGWVARGAAWCESPTTPCSPDRQRRCGTAVVQPGAAAGGLSAGVPDRGIRLGRSTGVMAARSARFCCTRWPARPCWPFMPEDWQCERQAWPEWHSALLTVHIRHLNIRFPSYGAPLALHQMKGWDSLSERGLAGPRIRVMRILLPLWVGCYFT